MKELHPSEFSLVVIDKGHVRVRGSVAVAEMTRFFAAIVGAMVVVAEDASCSPISSANLVLLGDGFLTGAALLIFLFLNGLGCGLMDSIE